MQNVINEVRHDHALDKIVSPSMDRLACRLSPQSAWLIFRRSAAAVPSDAKDLIAGANSDVGRLGGAIAARMRKSNQARISCIGPKAAYCSIKAVVTASDYLRQDPGACANTSLGVQITESSGKAESGAEAEGQLQRSVMHLDVEILKLPDGWPGAADQAVQEAPSSSRKREKTHDLIVGAKTQAGSAAAAMAGALRPKGGGHGDIPAVRAIGAVAVHRAMVATSLARRYLDTDDRDVDFMVVPNFELEHSAGTGSGKQKQLVLRLMRTRRTSTKEDGLLQS